MNERSFLEDRRRMKLGHDSLFRGSERWRVTCWSILGPIEAKPCESSK